MSDDLSAFFAKKKDKKKKAAVKIEDVGHVLERKAKKLEELESHLQETNEKRQDDENNTEDSEWIEYGDPNQASYRLEGLNIRDMGLEAEIIEEDEDELDEGKELEKETKTWGQLNEKKKAEEPERAVTMSDKEFAHAFQKQAPAPRKYVVPGLARHSNQANLDVTSDTLFPSLADASKIEKKKKDEKPGTGGWVQSGNRVLQPTNTNNGRDAAMAAVKSVFGNATVRQSTPAAEASATPLAAPEVKKAGKYVPPNLRRN